MHIQFVGQVAATDPVLTTDIRDLQSVILSYWGTRLFYTDFLSLAASRPIVCHRIAASQQYMTRYILLLMCPEGLPIP